MVVFTWRKDGIIAAEAAPTARMIGFAWRKDGNIAAEAAPTGLPEDCGIDEKLKALACGYLLILALRCCVF
jgi:hypothetical protein